MSKPQVAFYQGQLKLNLGNYRIRDLAEFNISMLMIQRKGLMSLPT